MWRSETHDNDSYTTMRRDAGPHDIAWQHTIQLPGQAEHTGQDLIRQASRERNKD
jgi:hypothetical protein